MERFLGLVIVLLLFVISSSAQVESSCTPAPANLVSWWQGEGDASDAAATNSGTLAGNAGFTAGMVGQAFSFDGYQDAVVLSNAAPLQLQTLTVEAWIKRSHPSTITSDPSGTAAIFSFGAAGYGFGLFADGRLFLSKIGVDNVSSSVTIGDTNWHHVAVTKSGSTVVFFVDGVGYPAPNYAGTFVFSSSPAIGARGDNKTISFWGAIDELAVYNRALSSNEVQTIYNAAASGKCPPPPPPPCTPAPANLVSWWQADGNASDAVATNSGTLVGNTSFTVGKVGEAFAFDGNGDGVLLGNPAGLQLQNFTIETWIKRSSPTLASTDGHISGAGILVGYGSGGYGFVVYNNGQLSLTKIDYSEVRSTTTITDTNWHHVAVTKSGSTVIFYIDGVANPVAAYNPGFTFNYPIAIGLRGDIYRNCFYGSIDELAIYDRALSSSEIQSIYNASVSGKCPPPPPCTPAPANLVSWWQAEGNASDAVATNSGTLVGNTGFTAGKVGSAFAFDGINGYVEVPDVPALRLTSELTIEFWVRRQQLDWYTGYVINKGGDWTRGKLNYGVDLAGPQYGYHLAFLFAGGVRHSTGIGDTNWHHCAVVARQGDPDPVFYIDGVEQPVTVRQGSGTLNLYPSTEALHIGAQIDPQTVNYFSKNAVDELGIYNRALSSNEIAAIYNASMAGKCSTPTAPFIITQPTNQTVSVGGSASFSLAAGGSQPLSYQWRRNSTNIVGATNASLNLAGVQFGQAGNYSVVVSNAVGSVTSSNAQLTVVFPPANLRVVDVAGKSGDTIALPVQLLANGNENALGFSLSFNTNLLSVSSVSPGSDAVGASVLANTSQNASGRVGVALALDSAATFAPGTQEVAIINFNVVAPPANSNRAASVIFGDIPTTRQLSDATAQTLSATYSNGLVTVLVADWEGDVAPRTNGDRQVLITDWVQVGRFAAKLDTPNPGGEFQRADCAPRSNLGNGNISITDWVQAGRYVVGLDPLTLAGGPTVDSGKSVSITNLKRPNGLGRVVRVIDRTIQAAETNSVAVVLESQGDENALGFSLNFNPALFHYVSVVTGSDAAGAALNINTNLLGTGNLGFALALPSGNSFSAGARNILNVNFAVSPTAVGMTNVSFVSNPIAAEISDPAANTLTASYSPATLIISPFPPFLRAERVGADVIVAWPAVATDFTLQLNDSGPVASNWSTAPTSPVVVGEENVVTVSNAVNAQFFRLYRP